MASIQETLWVHNEDELHTTVQRLIAQGGVVQDQSPGKVTVFVKKKINVPLLIVLLVLGCLPGIVYLVWHLAANADQVATVQIGQPPNIGGYRPDSTATSETSSPNTEPAPPGVAQSPADSSPYPPSTPQEF